MWAMPTKEIIQGDNGERIGILVSRAIGKNQAFPCERAALNEETGL